MLSDLWYDEVYSYRTASLPFQQMLHSLLLGGDTNPPLYTVLLHFWLLLGSSDVHVKLFSLLFGQTSIGLVFYLGKMIGDVKLASVGAFLFAVSNSVIRYSVEARPYALFLFLSLLSTILFLTAIGRNPLWKTSTKVWIGYVTVTVLAIYTHWFSLLLPPLHIVGVLIYSRLTKRLAIQYGTALLTIICCSLPLLPFLWNQLTVQNTVGGFSWCGRPNHHTFIDLAAFFVGGKNLLALTLLIICLACLKKRPSTNVVEKITRRDLLYFSSYALLPVLVVATLSYALERYSFFVPRYFLIFIIGVQLLIAVSLSRLNQKLALLFLILFALNPVIKASRHWHRWENPYSRLAVELSQRQDRLVLHLTPMSYYPTLHYNHEGSPEQKIAFSSKTGMGYVLDYNLKGEAVSGDCLLDLDTGLQGLKEFYVVSDAIDGDPNQNDLATQINLNPLYRQVSEMKFGTITLDYYQLN